MRRFVPAPVDDELLSLIESVLLVSGEPVTVSSLATVTGASRKMVVEALTSLQSSLRRGIRLQLHDGSAQLVTAPENSEVVQRFLGTSRPTPLSRAALETLAIVAYRQPITRAEIEASRGVNSDRAVMTLLARDLICEVGRRDTVGRPQEFGTTFVFLEHFGLGSLDELPQLEGAEQPNASAAGLGLRDSAGPT